LPRKFPGRGVASFWAHRVETRWPAENWLLVCRPRDSRKSRASIQSGDRALLIDRFWVIASVEHQACRERKTLYQFGVHIEDI
jgi:hypothetical protein